MHGGEIYVPKIPSYKITDVAEAIAPSLPHKVVGIRPGEKIHEEMITSADSYTTFDLGSYYAILPGQSQASDIYANCLKYSRFPAGGAYNSANNTDFLDVESLRKLIIKNIDPGFTPI